MKIFAIIFILSSLYNLFNQKRLLTTFSSVKLNFYSKGIGVLYRHLDFLYYLFSVLYIFFLIFGIFKSLYFIIPILFILLLLVGGKTKLSTYQVNIVYNSLKIIFLTLYIFIG